MFDAQQKELARLHRPVLLGGYSFCQIYFKFGLFQVEHKIHPSISSHQAPEGNMMRIQLE